MSTETKAISANNAMAILSRQNLQPHKELTLHVKTLSPNKIGGTACVRVVEMCKGIDWDDGKFLIETEHQLTQLSPEDVAAIHASAKEGQSWHVYQQYKKHDETVKQLQTRITELEAQLEAFKTERKDLISHMHTQALEIQQLADAQKDAERYQALRSGQKWSVIDGIGNTLRAEGLDEAIDSAATCVYCDGTDDVHSMDGEWRGVCTECVKSPAIQAEGKT